LEVADGALKVKGQKKHTEFYTSFASLLSTLRRFEIYTPGGSLGEDMRGHLSRGVAVVIRLLEAQACLEEAEAEALVEVALLDHTVLEPHLGKLFDLLWGGCKGVEEADGEGFKASDRFLSELTGLYSRLRQLKELLTALLDKIEEHPSAHIALATPCMTEAFAACMRVLPPRQITEVWDWLVGCIDDGSSNKTGPDAKVHLFSIFLRHLPMDASNHEALGKLALSTDLDLGLSCLQGLLQEGGGEAHQLSDAVLLHTALEEVSHRSRAFLPPIIPEAEEFPRQGQIAKGVDLSFEGALIAGGCSGESALKYNLTSLALLELEKVHSAISATRVKGDAIQETLTDRASDIARFVATVLDEPKKKEKKAVEEAYIRLWSLATPYLALLATYWGPEEAEGFLSAAISHHISTTNPTSSLFLSASFYEIEPLRSEMLKVVWRRIDDAFSRLDQNAYKQYIKDLEKKASELPSLALEKDLPPSSLGSITDFLGLITALPKAYLSPAGEKCTVLRAMALAGLTRVKHESISEMAWGLVASSAYRSPEILSQDSDIYGMLESSLRDGGGQGRQALELVRCLFFHTAQECLEKNEGVMEAPQALIETVLEMLEIPGSPSKKKMKSVSSNRASATWLSLLSSQLGAVADAVEARLAQLTREERLQQASSWAPKGLNEVEEPKVSLMVNIPPSWGAWWGRSEAVALSHLELIKIPESRSQPGTREVLDVLAALMRLRRCAVVNQLEISGEAVAFASESLLDKLGVTLELSSSLLTDTTMEQPLVESAAQCVKAAVSWLPLMSPPPNDSVVRILSAVSLYAIANQADSMRVLLIGVVTEMARGLDDDQFAILMEGFKGEIEAGDSKRAAAAVACLHAIIRDSKTQRVIQTVSGRGFHALPLLVSLVVHYAGRAETDPNAELAVKVSMEVLGDLMGRDRTIKFTNRHVMLTLHAALAVLQKAVPWPLEVEATEQASDGVTFRRDSFSVVHHLLVAIIVHRPRQWKACLPSVASCLQHMLLSIAVYCLPSSSARQLSRLIEAVVSETKAAFRKHACYFLSDYLSRFRLLSVDKSVSHDLMDGIFLMLDILEENERQQLHNALDATGRESLKQLHTDYERDFKFRGAV